MMDEVAMEQVFSSEFLFSLANHHSTIAPYPSITAPPEVCDSPDHAAQYHILGL
jgi:hypothetical protein